MPPGCLGNGGPRTFNLTLTPHGEAPRIFDALPMAGSDFAELHWLGFRSTALENTAFFLDNLRIKRLPPVRPTDP